MKNTLKKLNAKAYVMTVKEDKVLNQYIPKKDRLL